MGESIVGGLINRERSNRRSILNTTDQRVMNIEYDSKRQVKL